MSEIKFTELKCQRCGGELEEQNSGVYMCVSCGKKWQAASMHNFTDMLKSCEEALRAQRIADISNLRHLLWKETHNENVTNIKVSEYCTDILKYLPNDFYANFYLATCDGGKSAVGDFLFAVDVKEHYDDIALVLDYLLNALKSEWVMGVSNFIEKIKDVDVSLYNEYRTKFEKKYEKIEEGVFEPANPRDVFLAYSSKDMAEVTKLVAAFEEENLSCFVAARNMQHGSGAADNYEKILQTAIKNCQVVVFVSSDNSRSSVCDAHKELNYIKDNREAMPRVEYLLKNYSGKAAERFFTEFFEGHEYCTSVKDTVARVSDIIMKGAKGEENKNQQQIQKAKQENKKAEEQKAIKDSLSFADFKDIVGGYATFGAYPQSKKSWRVKIGELYDKSRGYYKGSDNCLYEEYQGAYYKVEPIKWKVLARGEEWLLIADKILDTRCYGGPISEGYETSDIRTWLNGEFYSKAFNDDQKRIILEKQNRVFLLSKKECDEYIKGKSALKKSGSDYAYTRGLESSGIYKNCWWLSGYYSFSTYDFDLKDFKTVKYGNCYNGGGLYNNFIATRYKSDNRYSNYENIYVGVGAYSGGVGVVPAIIIKQQ